MRSASATFAILAFLGFTASGCELFWIAPRATVGPILNTHGKLEVFATLGAIISTKTYENPSSDKFHLYQPIDFGASYHPEKDRYHSVWNFGVGVLHKTHRRFDLRANVMMNMRGILVFDGAPRDFVGFGTNLGFMPSLGHIPASRPYYSVHLGTELQVYYYHNFDFQGSLPPSVGFALPLVFEMSHPYSGYIQE